MKRQFINDVGGKFKVALKSDADMTVAHLLWGDPVRVQKTSGARVKIKARGTEGWVPKAAITDDGLLELYVIDVGQGDGVLMRTPDDAWHLIDAGIANDQQMTRKGAANFIRWKFQSDLGEQTVHLRNVILSHPDFDHYGGMVDLFRGKVQRPDRQFPVRIDNFFHSGMGRFAKEPKLGKTVEGSVGPLPQDDYGIGREDSFITELLDGKASFSNPARPFEATFAEFAELVGKVPGKVRRLSHKDAYVPGYKPTDGPVSISILGPIAEDLSGGVQGLRDLGSESVTRNGHSIVLRVDYDKVRILLTGDLNTASQRLLLSYQPLLEFAADVAKGCHHGSDDIDLRFVRAMKARATIVSSGDNEDYAHPRPRILGASARYGREGKSVRGETLPPLLYSTELARSVRLCYSAAVRQGSDGTPIKAADAEIKSAERGAQFVPLDETPISTDLVYGLINIRTDGTRVLCGYMKEGGNDFEIQVFRAGVEP